jgi:hypothetical protein
MDSGIIFALVLAGLFLGGIVWLIVYANKQSRTHTIRTSIKPSESQTKDKAARHSVRN